jgi:hypothetical protein
MAEATLYVPGLLHPDSPGFTVSSGGGGQIVYYVSDPNTEALTPDDTASEAIAVSSTGTGPSYTWEITSQTWV